MKRQIAEKISRIQEEIRLLRRDMLTLRKASGRSTGADEESSSSGGTLTVNKCLRKKERRARNRMARDGKELKRKEGLMQIQIKTQNGIDFDRVSSQIDEGSSRKQERQIEHLQNQLRFLRLFYERQMASIKCSAELLECQLRKLQSSLQVNLQHHNLAFDACGQHYKQILTAINNLQAKSKVIFGTPPLPMRQAPRLAQQDTSARVNGESLSDLTYYKSSTIAYITDKYSY